MAHLVLSQLSVTVPVGIDSSLRTSSVFKSNNVRFGDKSWASLLSLDLKSRNAQLRNRYVVCMSVQQASRSKVAVKPLELEDAKEPPLNLYKPKEPYTATIVSVERIVGSKAPGETCHIVIDHDGNVPYWEGQSYGVIPPGENPKKPGSPHNVRLYSIASTRYGDSFNGKTTSLCVRRAVYYDPETGKEDPSKNGVCSNFLCNSKPGDKIRITGPSGKIMLLPEDDPNATHIMIATGTGVAPYRGYLRRMFMESIPNYKFGGLAWLFLGVANSDSLLYDDEFTKYLQDYPDHFRYDKALSREQKNKNGGKMYVQDKIEEYSDEIFKLLDGGAHIYFCGLKGMMPGIQETLKRVADQRGENWDQKRCPHRSEIQSIVLAETDSNGYFVLGSVDSYGHFIVSKLDTSGKDVDRLTYSVLPQDCGVGEGSWAGLCFSPSQWSMAAVARCFSKSIDVYDQDIHLRTLRTLWYPSSLSFMQNLSNENGSSILAVTEGCQLTLWDLRMKENGGCLRRICSSVGDNLYAVCGSPTGNVAVAGADRTVTIYDPRRWSALSRWVHCSKYEITGLAFSSINSDYIYVQGVDYEVFCGQWKGSSKVFSFRGDSNWLGFSKCSDRDVLGGWSDSGSIFVVDVGAKESDINLLKGRISQCP